jgi:hypothetical protein
VRSSGQLCTELLDQSRLADARLASTKDELTFAGLRARN